MGGDVAVSGTWEWAEERFGRRDFLLKVGWAFFYVFLGGWLLSNLRYLFPNVLYEPSLLFKAGKPEDYALGVSEKWKKAQRAWVIRTPEGFYCLWARCTHLGCTPNWFEAEGRFKCPCHGSNFNLQGDVLAGPAPKPLWRCQIALGPDGQLVIDKGRLENRPDQRGKDVFFLPYKTA
ncbi:MAG: ubiquinol-cytochrome c reductase iron-sulfur subunit [Candidatus Omnitrophica bacterium]|nr:ubiquinol-cytochrome c reductase iron-sulfur subunit [Candidatus Omnitrophota bacterium]